MTINAIKKKMLEFRDFYGGDLCDIAAIERATTEKELAKIIEDHRDHMEAMLADADSHLDQFKKSLGLSIL
jgi:hypothetical protein